MMHNPYIPFLFKLFPLCVPIVTALQLVACDRLTHPSLEPFAAYQLRPLAVSREGLHARFFGATTIQIDDGETAIMVDGFFSRPGLAQLLLMKIEPNEERITAALAEVVPKPAAVLVAHSHYDHAMDSAVVAQQTGAVLLGTNSTANIGHGYPKLPSERIQIPKHGEIRPIGRFRVQFFESPHSPDFWFPGQIKHPLKTPVSFGEYREGRNYSFLLRHPWGTVLIHPSANYSPGMYQGVNADIVFLSIGMLGNQPEAFAREYWQQVVRATGAKIVIPIHWDDLTRPIKDPLIPMPYLVDDFNAAVQFIIEMAQADRIHVRFMPLFHRINMMDTIKDLSEPQQAQESGISGSR